MSICWENMVNDQYQIGSIVPKDVALEFASSLDRDEVTEEYIKEYCKRIINEKKNWSRKLSYKGIGARYVGAYKMKLSNRRAFKSWVFAKTILTPSSPQILYAWNPNTKERIYLSNFEFYIIFCMYRNAFINHSQFNIFDGKAHNTKSFNYPIF